MVCGGMSHICLQTVQVISGNGMSVMFVFLFLLQIRTSKSGSNQL